MQDLTAVLFQRASGRLQAEMHQLAELGFIVVQIDGMGTSNRSKAFHDVCWKNIKDAGFPDRILWMKAAAKNIPIWILKRLVFMEHQQEDRMLPELFFSIPNFIKLLLQHAAVTITGWIRCGGMNNGWDGRLERNMHSRQMLRMPGD